MNDLYVVPRGVRLNSDRVRAALADVGIDSFSYVANGVLNHVFLHRHSGAKLCVVVSHTSKLLSEVVGATALWLTVRKVAADATPGPTPPLSGHAAVKRRTARDSEDVVAAAGRRNP